MKITKDHDNYDYLSVSLKSEYSDKIMKCYLALGWKDVHTEDDKDYSDMKYVLFSRPHSYPNKDRLQYIQVRMESILNKASEHAIRRHKKSTALAVLLGLSGLLLVAGGLTVALVLPSLLLRVCGWICVGLGGACLLGMIYPLVRVRKKENERTKKSLEEAFIEFDKLIKEAFSLTSVNVVSERNEKDGQAVGEGE